MSRCFTWFLNCLVYENPIYTRTWFVLQEWGDFTWKVSDCEELVGVLQERMGLVFINRNRKLGWYEDGDEKKDGKYVGEIENRKPNGQGTHTYSNGEIYVGKWKGGSPWVGTKYNKNGKILGKWVNGKFQ